MVGKTWSDPRGVPPSVVEAEIANPGTTGVKVITNQSGDVVSVVPDESQWISTSIFPRRCCSSTSFFLCPKRTGSCTGSHIVAGTILPSARRVRLRRGRNAHHQTRRCGGLEPAPNGMQPGSVPREQDVRSCVQGRGVSRSIDASLLSMARRLSILRRNVMPQKEVAASRPRPPILDGGRRALMRTTRRRQESVGSRSWWTAGPTSK